MLMLIIVSLEGPIIRLFVAKAHVFNKVVGYHGTSEGLPRV